MSVKNLILLLGEEVQDPDKETFLLFSQAIPSKNLGFVDPKAKTLEIDVRGQEYNISQSPSALSSHRSEGTTGAVLWKISPLFADWISTPSNVFFSESVLTSGSTVLELGCGIAGIVAMALGPRVGHYIATDQHYVLKILEQNLEENGHFSKDHDSKEPKKRRATHSGKKTAKSDIKVMGLDWELSSLTLLPEFLGGSDALDAMIACDCVYNEMLIYPFVRTCTEICSFRQSLENLNPTICIVAQQLRSSDIFFSWLVAFCKSFRVWRLPDNLLTSGLHTNSGYVVHLGILSHQSLE